jgi:hypothetical protein
MRFRVADLAVDAVVIGYCGQQDRQPGKGGGEARSNAFVTQRRATLAALAGNASCCW